MLSLDWRGGLVVVVSEGGVGAMPAWITRSSSRRGMGGGMLSSMSDDDDDDDARKREGRR
jgi:hypothetical protein